MRLVFWKRGSSTTWKKWTISVWTNLTVTSGDIWTSSIVPLLPKRNITVSTIGVKNTRSSCPCSDFLTYPLPPDGVPTEDDSSEGTLQLTQRPQAPQDKPLHIDEEKDKDGHSHWVYLKEALSLLLCLLLLLLAALILRILFLRRKALRRRRGFADPDRRLAAGRMLAYSAELLALLGLPPDNLPLPQKRDSIARILHTDEDLDTVLALCQELWFSAHPVTDAQSALAARWLAHLEAVWRQDTPCLKRFSQRWLTGRVI